MITITFVIILIVIMSHRNILQHMLAVCGKSLAPLGWLVLGNTVGICDVNTWKPDSPMSFQIFHGLPTRLGPLLDQTSRFRALYYPAFQNHGQIDVHTYVPTNMYCRCRGPEQLPPFAEALCGVSAQQGSTTPHSCPRATPI